MHKTSRLTNYSSLLLFLIFFLVSCENRSSNADQLYHVVKNMGAISHSFDNMIKEFSEKTLQLMGQKKTIKVNESPCSDCLNIFILKTEDFYGIKDQSVLGVSIEEFGKQLEGNALAIGSNLLIFDEKLIAGITYEATNYAIGAMNIKSSINESSIFDINETIYQGQYLSYGNTIGMRNGDPQIIGEARKFAESFYENFNEKEIDRLKYIISTGRGPENFDDERLIWLLIMRGQIGGQILKGNTSKYVNPSKIIYGAFIMLLSHEIAHLSPKNSSNGSNSWESLDNWILHYENRKNRIEEDRADKVAFGIFESYLDKLLNDQSSQTRFTETYTTLAFSNLMRNQVLIENLHYIRGVHIQDFLIRILVNDCKKFQTKLPHWNFERIISASNEEIPVLTQKELNKIREEFSTQKFISTHAHYLERSEYYNQKVLNTISQTNSWIKEFYPFEKKILDIWTGNEEDVSSMINPQKYGSGFNKKRIRSSKFLQFFDITEIDWKNGANCPSESCWIGEFKEFKNVPINGFVELVANKDTVVRVKVVILPQDAEKLELRDQLAELTIEKLKNIFEIEFLFFSHEPKFSKFLSQLQDCNRASIWNSHITMRSVSDFGIAIEIGDITEMDTKRLVSEYEPKLKNIGVDDSLIYNSIKQSSLIYKEFGISGLQEAVTDCYGKVENISDVKDCFTQHLFGFDIDRKFTSLMEKNMSKTIPTQEFFKSENVQNYVDKAFFNLGISSDSTDIILENWKTKYLWYSTVVFSDDF